VVYFSTVARYGSGYRVVNPGERFFGTQGTPVLLAKRRAVYAKSF